MDSKQWAQFNVRVDREILDAYRICCGKQARDPQRLVVKFMERVVKEPEFADALLKQ